MAKRLDARFVKRFRWPAYPTKLEVLATPELLRRYLPPQWRARSEMLGAAALFVAGGTIAGNVSCIPTPGIPAAPTVTCLSESEAVQLIKDELTRRGVLLETENVPLPGVQIEGARGEPRQFVVDLADMQRAIAVEYVGEGDYWQYSYTGGPEELELPEVAQLLTDQVDAHMPELYFRAFYTPGDPWLGTCSADAARDALREQVKDFVNWLKAQGVI